MSSALRTSRLLLLLLLLALAGAASPWAEGTASAAPSCSAAKALADSGRIPAAEETYAKALEEPATEGCATAGLKQLDETRSPCASANALKEAGRAAEAQAAYEKVLEKRPSSECAKEGVAAPETHFWDDPKGAAEDLLAWIGLIVVGLAVLAALIALLLVPITRIPRLRDWLLVRRIRAIRLGIDSFEDNSTPSQGATLAALARSKMESFGAGNQHMGMVDSRAAAEETIWNKLGGINDQAKGVSAVIEAIGSLYPRRQFQVTGVVQTDSGNGPGLSLSVRRKQSIVGATTLWAESFGLEAGAEGKETVDRLQKLAAPAAAWISHVSLTASGEIPGGARDPISWALFKTGGEWERDGNEEKAAALYKAARSLDSSNWGAIAELGRMESEKYDWRKDDGGKSFREAANLLRKALALLETPSATMKTLPPNRNVDWYRVKYRLASTLTNEAFVRKGDYAEAKQQIDELLTACWPILKPSPLELWLGRNQEVREFVTKTVQYAALNLKALIEMERDGERAGEKEVIGLRAVRRRLQKGLYVSPLTIVEEVLWNKRDKTDLLLLDIACFFQLSGDRERARHYACEALAMMPESEQEQLRAEAARDPMLKEIPELRTPGRRPAASGRNGSPGNPRRPRGPGSDPAAGRSRR